LGQSHLRTNVFRTYRSCCKREVCPGCTEGGRRLWALCVGSGTRPGTTVEGLLAASPMGLFRRGIRPVCRPKLTFAATGARPGPAAHSIRSEARQPTTALRTNAAICLDLYLLSGAFACSAFKLRFTRKTDPSMARQRPAPRFDCVPEGRLSQSTLRKKMRWNPSSSRRSVTT
jgi:hypothetical protein